MKQTFRIASQEKQIHAIDLFPHLDGDLFAYSPSIFSCEGQAGVNRVRIFPLERDEINDGFTRNLGVMFFEELGVFQCVNDRFPMLLGAGIEQLRIEHELEIDIHHPSVVLGTFRVSTQPVKSIGNSA